VLDKVDLAAAVENDQKGSENLRKRRSDLKMEKSSFTKL
jgi:hypothetical protein